MKCPRCKNGKLRHSPSGHDEHTIAYCENPRCDFQEVVGAPERANNGEIHWFNTSTVTDIFERDYNGI